MANGFEPVRVIASGHLVLVHPRALRDISLPEPARMRTKRGRLITKA
jgi:hypothetical protein